MLGHGEFGEVFAGTYLVIISYWSYMLDTRGLTLIRVHFSQGMLPVALKTFKITTGSVAEFLAEATIMKKLRHQVLVILLDDILLFLSFFFMYA